MPAPIALFVYNRPEHTRRTVEALQRNALAEASDLYVYSDAPRSEEAAANVSEVRSLVAGVTGFKSVTVIERPVNLGVDASVIDGVTALSERFGEVIVLEDDLVTSPWFLTYMNEGLNRYRDEPRVMQIAGFMFPIADGDPREAAFLPYATCWGWATWNRAWQQFDASASGYEVLKRDPVKRRAFDLDDAFYYFGLLRQVAEGTSTAWDIRWYLTIFQHAGLALFPFKSLVENIGFDGSGVHDPMSGLSDTRINETPISLFPSEFTVDETLWTSVQEFLFAQKPRNLIGSVKRVFRQWSTAFS